MVPLVRISSVVSFAVLALPASAGAQPGMTPGMTPATAPATTPPPASRLWLEVGVGAASPRGDWAEVPVDSSPAVFGQLGLAMSPNLSLFVGARRIQIELASELAGQGVSAAHHELQLGLRYTSPLGPSARLFLEGHLASVKLTVDAPDGGGREAGAGAGVRGGLIFAVGRAVGIGGALGGTSAMIDADGDEFEDAWVTVDGFVSLGF
jgi:hypothetical protein